MPNSPKKSYLWDSAALLLAGLSLGAYALIGFYTAAMQTLWLLSPYLFPLLLAALALLLSVFLYAEGRRAVPDTEKKAPSPEGVKRLLAVLLASALYAAGLAFIPFIPATALFLAGLMLLLGERRPATIAAVAVLVPLILYALFGLGLNVRLP